MPVPDALLLKLMLLPVHADWAYGVFVFDRSRAVNR